MAVFTAVATGFHADAPNWDVGGGLYPGVEDSAIIPSAYTITTNGAWAVGVTTGAAATAISIAGTLSVGLAGNVLTVYGNTVIANGTFRMVAGTAYHFGVGDAGQIYKIAGGDAAGQTASRFISDGTLAQPCYVTKDVGAGNGLIGRGASGATYWLGVEFHYTIFTFLGTSSSGYGNDAIESNINGATQSCTYDHCVFGTEGATTSYCGRIYNVSCLATRDISVVGCRMYGSLRPTQSFQLMNTAKSSGVRVITDNCFDEPTVWAIEGPVAGWTIDRNVGRPFMSGTGVNTAHASCEDNYVSPRERGLLTTLTLGMGTLTNTLVFVDTAASAASEAKGLGHPNSGASLVSTWRHVGLVLDCSAGDENGDGQTVQSAAVGASWTFEYVDCLTLPNSRRKMGFNLVAFHGNTRTQIGKIQNCTLMVASNISPSTTGFMGWVVGNSFAGKPGMVALEENNIYWQAEPPPAATNPSTVALAGYKYINSDHTGTDSGTGTNTTCNGYTGLLTTAGVKLADSSAYLVVTSSPDPGVTTAPVGESKAITDNTATTITTAAFDGGLTLAGCGTRVVVRNIITTSRNNAHGNLDQGGVCYDINRNNPVSTPGYQGFCQNDPSTINTNGVQIAATSDQVTGGYRFVDPWRNTYTAYFDLFGDPYSATTWADATAYTVGQFVKAQTSDFYNNSVVGYYCILAHTSSNGHATNGKPGEGEQTGKLWRTNWKAATHEVVARSLYAGTTYEYSQHGIAAGTNVIKAITSWIKAGLRSRNPAIRGTASDGGDIGATDYLSTDAEDTRRRRGIAVRRRRAA